MAKFSSNDKVNEHVKKTIEATGNEGKWEGAEVETQSDPMIDPGLGKAVILRFFEFQKNPQLKKLPEKQELFNYHWKEIRNFLWRDGLVPFEQVNPRVMVGRKRYRIGIACKPRIGTMVLETPQNLNKVLAGK